MKRSYLLIALISLLSLPTFVRMLQPGIFSMQDFPYFRLIEYSKCISSFQIPCRWSLDSGLGFGEPVFNFYSQIPFLLGSILNLLGLGGEMALKIVFSFSLLGSALSMYFLAKDVWKNEWAGVVSAILYLYAPYRAVNVWVRGAFPESFAFIFLPLILLFFEKFLKTEKKRWAILYSVNLALLILTHNLSVILFSHAIGAWIIVRVFQTKKVKLFIPVIISSAISILLSAFYLLPSIFESSLVNLQLTTLGYFDFRAHFVTIPQLFISRYWGYGGSTWGSEDGLSLSIGHAQWVIATVVLFIASFMALKKRKIKDNELLVVHLVLCGLFYLFLTHNKSAFLWESFSPVMKFIQFPWRFLGVAVFSFSLAGGYLISIFNRWHLFLSAAVITIAMFLTVGFFREDIWFKVSDKQLQSGEMWVEQSRASIGDYWPKYGPIPKDFNKESDLYTKTVKRTSNELQYRIMKGVVGKIELPVTYFPGWSGYIDGQRQQLTYSESGLVVINIPEGSSIINLKFEDTPIRTAGNIISLITLLGLMFVTINKKYGFIKKH